MSPTSTPYGDPPAEAKVASSNGAVNINVSADANGDVQAGGLYVISPSPIGHRIDLLL